MARKETRAIFHGISTAKLRRLADARIRRIRMACADIDAGWDADEDPMIEQALDLFDRAVKDLETSLSETAEYYDEEVGS